MQEDGLRVPKFFGDEAFALLADGVPTYGNNRQGIALELLWRENL